MAKAIRVPQGTVPKDSDFASGKHYPTVGDAVQGEHGIADGRDPWIKGDSIYVGPDDIGPLKKTMDKMRDDANGT